jgi:hypothetical protein
MYFVRRSAFLFYALLLGANRRKGPEEESLSRISFPNSICLLLPETNVGGRKGGLDHFQLVCCFFFFFFFFFLPILILSYLSPTFPKRRPRVGRSENRAQNTLGAHYCTEQPFAVCLPACLPAFLHVRSSRPTAYSHRCMRLQAFLLLLFGLDVAGKISAAIYGVGGCWLCVGLLSPSFSRSHHLLPERAPPSLGASSARLTSGKRRGRKRVEERVEERERERKREREREERSIKRNSTKREKDEGRRRRRILTYPEKEEEEGVFGRPAGRLASGSQEGVGFRMFNLTMGPCWMEGKKEGRKEGGSMRKAAGG